ncbi:MAG: cytochrome c [Deltaproteobacteria bacterium]|nr:cytochrome c [Deltaproteobacteria bacterium]
MRYRGICLLFLLVIFGCAAIPKVADTEIQEAMRLTGVPAAGKVVYEKNCIYCHREKGEGGGVAVGTLERAMPKRDEDLYRAVKEGKGDWMPAFSKMTPKDTMDVIAYMRSLFEGK